jgi:hypothetical protein
LSGAVKSEPPDAGTFLAPADAIARNCRACRRTGAANGERRRAARRGEPHTRILFASFTRPLRFRLSIAFAGERAIGASVTAAAPSPALSPHP